MYRRTLVGVAFLFLLFLGSFSYLGTNQASAQTENSTVPPTPTSTPTTTPTPTPSVSIFGPEEVMQGTTETYTVTSVGVANLVLMSKQEITYQPDTCELPGDPVQGWYLMGCPGGVYTTTISFEETGNSTYETHLAVIGTGGIRSVLIVDVVPLIAPQVEYKLHSTVVVSDGQPYLQNSGLMTLTLSPNGHQLSVLGVTIEEKNGETETRNDWVSTQGGQYQMELEVTNQTYKILVKGIRTVWTGNWPLVSVYQGVEKKEDYTRVYLYLERQWETVANRFSWFVVLEPEVSGIGPVTVSLNTNCLAVTNWTTHPYSLITFEPLVEWIVDLDTELIWTISGSASGVKWQITGQTTGPTCKDGISSLFLPLITREN